jgi:hypothetical protein
VFEVMARHGAGQVLSHWTWLPPLEKQLAKAGGRMLNSGKSFDIPAIISFVLDIPVLFRCIYKYPHCLAEKSAHMQCTPHPKTSERQVHV